jgi:SAM-dependent methyltransferase
MTDWEQRYQSGDTPWEKGSASPALLEMLARDGLADWGAGPVVVPGCGTGHDVRALAGACGLEVIGVDLAPSAVRAAEGWPRVGRERYAQGDFLAVEWPPEGLEATAIWEHTCFCAIGRDRRGDYARAAARTLAPGGRLIGVFFLTPWDPGEDPQQGPPFAATREEIIATFEPWFKLVNEWRPQMAYAGREGREWCAIFERAGGGNVC